jgi:hypothetical protein
MNLTITQFDQIEAHLKGQLSEKNQADFEQKLAQSPDLQAELQTQMQLRSGLQTLALQSRIKAAQQRYAAPQERVEPVVTAISPKQNWLNAYWLAAASVILVLGFGWLYQARYYISSDVLAMADQEMSYKSLPMALPKTATTTDKKRLTLQQADWYFALAYIKKGEKQKAKTMLKRIATTEGHLCQSKAKKLVAKM